MDGGDLERGIKDGDSNISRRPRTSSSAQSLTVSNMCLTQALAHHRQTSRKLEIHRFGMLSSRSARSAMMSRTSLGINQPLDGHSEPDAEILPDGHD